jgi:hypothetical protein
MLLGWWNLYEVGPSGRTLSAIEGDSEALVLSSLFLSLYLYRSLSLPGHEVSSFVLPFTPTIAIQHSIGGPKQWVCLIMNCTFKTARLNKPFFFKSWLSQVFFYSTRKLTTTPGLWLFKGLTWGGSDNKITHMTESMLRSSLALGQRYLFLSTEQLTAALACQSMWESTSGQERRPRMELWYFCNQIFFFFFVVLEFELRAYTLRHSTSPFEWFFFFKIGSQEPFAWGWFWIAILLISASWVSRITGMASAIFYLLKQITKSSLYTRGCTPDGIWTRTSLLPILDKNILTSQNYILKALKVKCHNSCYLFLNTSSIHTPEKERQMCPHVNNYLM